MPLSDTLAAPTRPAGRGQPTPRHEESFPCLVFASLPAEHRSAW